MNTKRMKGVTAIEILIVIGIMAILAALLVAAQKDRNKEIVQEELIRSQCEEVLDRPENVGLPIMVRKVDSSLNEDGTYPFFINNLEGTHEAGLRSEDPITITGLSSLASFNRVWYIATIEKSSAGTEAREYFVVSNFNGRDCSVVDVTNKIVRH